MLKAIVSYSKKVPAEKQYSSQGYSLSLETEIPETDPAAIQSRLSETFQLVKQQVETELANGNGVQADNTRPAPFDPGSNEVPTGNGDRKATNGQIKFVTDLARMRGIALSDLNAQVRDLYGATGIYDLGKKDASKLIDSLKAERQKAA